MVKLNLGCGYEKKDGFINIDNNIYCNPDIVLDINGSLPFKDNESSEIYMSHIISYVNDINFLFREIYRVCGNNAKIVIKNPHYSFGFADPNHKRGISLEFINFINAYNNTRFRSIYTKMYWMRSPSNIFLKGLHKVISLLANLNKKFCERVWCYWVGGFEELIFEVKVEK